MSIALAPQKRTAAALVAGLVLAWNAIPAMAFSTDNRAKLNEWMAENSSTVATGAGEFVPWFELYNPNTYPVDLAGYFLTDDPGEPAKYMIQPDFAIPAGGHLLIWADGTDTEAGGEIHVNFLLKPEDGYIGLFNPVGDVVDSVVITPQASDVSQGRFPDGTDALFTMNIPTPGSANTLGPIVTRQPEDQLAGPGDTVTWTIEAVGLEPLTYQWFVNGAVITGATNTSLAVSNITPADTGDYQVRVTDPLGTDRLSRLARLTLLEPPVISSQPRGVLVSPGTERVEFCVGSGSAGLRYQWYQNGFELIGETEPCLTLNTIAARHGGLYTVALINAAGAVLSQSAPLLLDIPGSPLVADRFRDRAALDGRNGQIVGDNEGAACEQGEPIHAGRSGGNSVWYDWVAPENGIATFETLGSTFDTVLAVYTGSDVSMLTEIASDDDRASYRTSRAQFNAVEGTTYHIAVAGVENEQGPFLLSWSHLRTSNPLPVFTIEPESQAVPRGATALFHAASRTAGDRFQWYFNDEAILNATSATLSISNVQSSDVGGYSVQLLGERGRSTFSRVGKLDIGACPEGHLNEKILSHLVSCDLPPISMLFDILPPDCNAFTYGAFLDVDLGDEGDSESSNAQGNSGVDCEHPASKQLWGYYEAQATGELEFDTDGSPVSAHLVAYEYVTPNPSTWVRLGCDFTNAPALPSRVRVPATQGTRYAILTAGYQGASGQVRLNHRLGAAPELSPLVTTYQLKEGDTLSLHASAPGWIPQPHYQWYRNGVAIENATAATFTNPGLGCADGGDYSVSVSNWVSSVTNLLAVVLIDAPVKLSANVLTNNGIANVRISAVGGRPFEIQSTDGLPPTWTPLATHSIPCVPYELYLPFPPGRPPIRLYRAVELP